MAGLTPLVPDASALVELLLEGSEGRVSHVLLASDRVLHIPYLTDIEVTSGLRKLVNRRLISPQRAVDALDDYASLPMTRHQHLWLLPRVLELRANFGAYDGTYVALAEGLGATIVTTDGPMARAATALLRLPVQVLAVR